MHVRLQACSIGEDLDRLAVMDLAVHVRRSRPENARDPHGSPGIVREEGLECLGLLHRRHVDEVLHVERAGGEEEDRDPARPIEPLEVLDRCSILAGTCELRRGVVDAPGRRSA